MSRHDLPATDAVAECLRTLTSLLEEDVRATSVTDAARNAVTARRDRALAHLDQALAKFESILAKDVIVESILVLGPSSHPTVKKALWQASMDCRERAGRMLLTSTHPKIMRQVIDSLKQSYPHPKAFEAVQTRTDLEFLCELLRAVTAKSGAMFEQNLKQIEHLHWLDAPEPLFDLIPQALQPALITLVFSTKVPLEKKSLVQQWLLQHGGPAGRMAAAERAAMVNEDVIQHVLIDSLDAEDEEVQAWAVTQLRQHAVPETFAILIQRLDSPLPGVRAAVREELSDFNLDRVLGLMDALDNATALRVGEIVRKIDEQALVKLERELLHALRPKRIRAARAIVKLGFCRDLLPQLVTLADDEDFMLRRTLAEVLDSVFDPEVLPILDRLAQDAHPRVRDAASNSIARWGRESAHQVDPLLVQ
jgi:HEAT repeat protein